MWKKNLSQSVFVLENPTHWDLEPEVCPIFVKPVFNIFAVCPLVLRIMCPICNLLPKNLLMSKKSKLLGKNDLRFLLSYELRTTTKITHSSTYCYE